MRTVLHDNMRRMRDVLVDGKGVVRGVWRKVKVPGHVWPRC
jgi:hypothetical protein